MTSKSKIVRTIPKSETGARVTSFTTSKKKYIISQNPITKIFTLWKEVKDGFEKIKTSRSPLEFDDMIPWDE